MQQGIRFEDGDAYDHGMAPWSRVAGQTFLDWLSPRPGLKWLDVGCGTGAFTGLLTERCAPAEVQGIDPSEGQLATARMRYGARKVTFRQADATALPFEERRFDAAVMALVIFFVPDPAKGAAEMARVVRPGGYVSAYAWDVLGGGFPFDPIWKETRAAGIAPLLPPNPSAGELQSLRSMWTVAGLEEVETREIVVERIFQTFEDYWATSTITGGVRPTLDAMPVAQRDNLKARVRTRMCVDDHGRVMWRARANAVKARVAG